MKKEELYIFVDTLRSSNGYTSQKKYSKTTMRHSRYKNSLEDKSEHSWQKVWQQSAKFNKRLSKVSVELQFRMNVNKLQHTNERVDGLSQFVSQRSFSFRSNRKVYKRNYVGIYLGVQTSGTNENLDAQTAFKGRVDPLKHLKSFLHCNTIWNKGFNKIN